MKIWRVLLALWLIASGLIVLLHLQMELLPVIMGLLAVAAGIFLLLDR